MGLSAALISMATTRLAMAVIPAMGRNHFFALYSVLGSLTLGLSPILWGILIDAFGPLQTAWGRFEWNRYTVFFRRCRAGLVSDTDFFAAPGRTGGSEYGGIAQGDFDPIPSTSLGAALAARVIGESVREKNPLPPPSLASGDSAGQRIGQLN
jgi:hypothetical protein